MMIRRTALTMVLLAACVWCLTLVARADSGAPAASFKPVASLDGLMYGQKHHFKMIGKLIKSKNAKDRTKRLSLEAQVLAELANVNTYHKDKPDYRGWAETLQNTSLELSKEAHKKKNADEARMASLYKKLKRTCTACHDVYQ